MEFLDGLYCFYQAIFSGTNNQEITRTINYFLTHLLAHVNRYCYIQKCKIDIYFLHDDSVAVH